jgi:hypothetical protein
MNNLIAPANTLSPAPLPQAGEGSQAVSPAAPARSDPIANKPAR